MNVLWHRLRGHRLTKTMRMTNYGLRCGVESGRVDYITQCSCGASWYDQ